MTNCQTIIPLAAGDTSANLTNFYFANKPVAARAEVMTQGATSNIFATADYTSFNQNGGRFNFDAPIPSDGTTYQLFVEFIL